MIKQDAKKILSTIDKEYLNKEIIILAPIIKSRKGHYSELFQSLLKQGYVKDRINNEIIRISPNLKLDRYKNHDIEIVIDKFTITSRSFKRLENSIKLALDEGKGVIVINDVIQNMRY